MDLTERLTTTERRFWTGGEAFYRENLAEDALMAFPEPVGLMERDAAIEAIAQGPRWEAVEFEDVRVLRLAPGAAILAYRARARREGDETPYAAAVSSAYVERDGSWKLAFHQQTPGGGE